MLYEKWGNLGESGCVSYLFDRKGYLAIERSGLDADEDELLLQAIEAGAEDMETSEEVFEIYTEPENFMAVKESLENGDLNLRQRKLQWCRKQRLS